MSRPSTPCSRWLRQDVDARIRGHDGSVRGSASVPSPPSIRLGLDIGGTFTDVALEVGDRRFTAKTLTTPRAPEQAVVAALRSVTAEAGVQPGQVNLIVHGTTLATNAIIERKGARTALLTTE